MSDLAVHCKGCGKPIPVDDVNINTRLAKCRGCNAVFDIADHAQGRVPRPRDPVPMPKQMIVAEGPESLTVEWKWSGMPTIFFLCFAVFWNFGVAVFIFAALSPWVKKEEGAIGLHFWLFMIPFVLIGIGTGWMALAFLLNKTKVSVEEKVLTVTHRPVRWFGERRLEASKISQLFCSEYVAYKQNEVPQYRMCVNAHMHDGSHLQLIKGLNENGQAFYLEDLLERHLGITDRSMPGEYRRSQLS